MSTENEDLVRNFCEAWSRRDTDELLGYFAEDAVYHNMPMAPVQGHEQIRSVFSLFVPSSVEIAWEGVGLASAGDRVYTERIDRFVMDDKKVDLLAAWTSQTG